MASRAYTVAFVAGVSLVAVGVGLGVFESVVTERRLPVIGFSNVEEIQRLITEGRYDDATSRLGMMLELMPQSRHVLHDLLGNAYKAQGEYATAIEHYGKAVELDPGFVEAYNDLGICHVGLGELRQAVTWFERALRVDPDFDPARQNLARAIEDFEELVGPDPSDDAVRRALASARATLAGEPTATESDELLEARALARRFFDGDLDWLHASFSESLSQRMSLEELTRLRAQLGEQLGAETELLGDRVTVEGGGQLYKRWSRYSKFPGVVELSFALGEGRAIDDLRVRLADNLPAELTRP